MQITYQERNDLEPRNVSGISNVNKSLKKKKKKKKKKERKKLEQGLSLLVS